MAWRESTIPEFRSKPKMYVDFPKPSYFPIHRFLQQLCVYHNLLLNNGGRATPKRSFGDTAAAKRQRFFLTMGDENQNDIRDDILPMVRKELWDHHLQMGVAVGLVTPSLHCVVTGSRCLC